MGHLHHFATLALAALLAGMMSAAPPQVAVPTPPANLELPAAKSPVESLAAMRVRPGFKVELVAAEPLVMDPVDIAWGPDGRLWVVEMADYPLGIDGKGTPGGRVKFLEDTDGDGKYDRATLFLDGLPYPNGVMPWRKGVLITAAPAVIYAEDTDGDGKADVRKTLYAGFGEGNQQHRVNGLRWGLDNWIYIANGDSDGRIRSAFPGGKGAQEVDIRGRDLRIRPDSGLLDTQTGRTQFGRNRDDWGNWFGCNNSNPMWHFVLAEHYLRRNPHLAAPKGSVPVSVASGTAPVYPISKTLARFNALDMANRFTSACGTMIYRDRLLGDAYYGNSFVSEPVHNLVHREIMSPTGVTFSSRRADDEQTSEFLASADNWFRPTVTHTGPDGALWVVDMYRLVIEHPQWIPLDWQKRIDLRAGHDRGRIYRVLPENAAPRSVPRLDKQSTADLVAVLGSENGWQRDMAQQMLLWRGDKSAAAPLRGLARSGKEPLARLHALCTLDALDALTAEDVAHALKDEHPGVRRHAIRLSEAFLAHSPDLGAALLPLVRDRDPQVIMQLAYTLGEWKDARAGTALAEIALKHAGDNFLRTAVASSLNASNVGTALGTVLSQAMPHASLVEELIRYGVALGDDNALERALALAGADKADARSLAALNGALTALKNRPELSKLLERPTVQKLLKEARAVAIDTNANEPQRLAALRLLAHRLGDEGQDTPLLAGLLNPRQPPSLQQAALAALGERGAQGTPGQVLSAWTLLTPQLRKQALELLLSRPAWTQDFLTHLEKDRSLTAHLDAIARQRLLTHKDTTIRSRAGKLLDGGDSDRKKVIDEFAVALTLKGDIARGREVFRKHCIVCHKLEGVGQPVGPDLAPLANKSSQVLLEAMLDPNRAVEDRYVSYLAATVDGQILIGLLANESGASVTLTGQDGKEIALLRSQLDELRSTGKSLMPEGMEKDISAQQFADMIAYMQSPALSKRP